MANLFFPEAEGHAQAKAGDPDVSPESGRRPGSGGSPVVLALGGLAQTACPLTAYRCYG